MHHAPRAGLGAARPVSPRPARSAGHSWKAGLPPAQVLGLTLPRTPTPRSRAYQAAALLAVLDPGVSAVVQGLPVLMEALTAQPWVTFRAAEKINRGILTVTDHPSAHYKPVLYEKGKKWSSKASIHQRACITHVCARVGAAHRFTCPRTHTHVPQMFMCKLR